MSDFKLPELGENISTATVARLLVGVGDTIAQDQAVLELETDKATLEVPSSVQGVVKAINVKAGDKVGVGTVVLSVDDAAAAGGLQQNVGPVRPTDTDKAGTIEAPPARRGAVVPMARSSRQAAELTPAAAPPESRGPVAAASPGVRREAREIGVDIEEVEGTGSEGRISQQDVKEHARRILTSVGSRSGAAARAAHPLPDFSKWGEVERKPMSGVRRKTAEHLSHAWQTIPHVTQCEHADITALEQLRREYSPAVEKDGAKLTMTAFLVKVLAAAVQQFPQFNASVDIEAAELVYKRYVHIGVAVDTDRGLLVPVIRDADTKSIAQIAVDVQEAAAKARAGKLTLDDMSGGGITISNLGGIGGTHFTPIVNWPEVAILGVSRGSMTPVHNGKDFAPRLMLPLSLSYDHRAIDGADAMRFLRWVVERLEQPFLLVVKG